MTVFFEAKPHNGGKGWIVSEHSKKQPVFRFKGTQEECECVAKALTELARERHEKLVVAEHQTRLEGLMRWDQDRNEKISALERGLLAFRGKQVD
jgi:late competence protein required for DNA uptake (superfamily II DNA/RNA helicase)